MVAKVEVLDLTRDVLADEAPDELLLIESFDPTLSCNGRTSAGPQGFGAETVIVIMLPFVYKFFEKILDVVAGRTADALYDSLKAWLSSEDIEDNASIAALIKRELASLGMPDAQAQKASHAILKSLHKNREWFALAKSSKRG